MTKNEKNGPLGHALGGAAGMAGTAVGAAGQIGEATIPHPRTASVAGHLGRWGGPAVDITVRSMDEEGLSVRDTVAVAGSSAAAWGAASAAAALGASALGSGGISLVVAVIVGVAIDNIGGDEGGKGVRTETKNPDGTYTIQEHTLIGTAWHNGEKVDRLHLRETILSADGKVISRSQDVTLVHNGHAVLGQIRAAHPNNHTDLGAAPKCFLAHTPITMADGSHKPIEAIRPGDQVLSYDDTGKLTQSRVTRTFQNEARQILDLHGLFITPGHATLCGDGPFEGQHVPIIDILRSDGALVLEDGSKIRAATGCKLGSEGDRLITAVLGDRQPDGKLLVTDATEIRLGTRVIIKDGHDISLIEQISAKGGTVTKDGMIEMNGRLMPFHWTFSPNLPGPEDYVLQRSATTLDDIYSADEWEAASPTMPAPRTGEGVMAARKGELHEPKVNEPLALRARVV